MTDILQGAKGIVYEGAQGVLLDQDYGFHPHTTWSKTTAVNALELARENGLIIPSKIGVTRTYLTRHGEGPFPSELYDMPYPELHNGDDGAPGQFRKGMLDGSLLTYAIKCNGGIDYLAVNHVDCMMAENSHQPVAMQYCVGDVFGYEKLPENRYDQEAMTRRAFMSWDKTRLPVKEKPAEWLAKKLDAKLLVTGSGPTCHDKVVNVP
jgi:adenylosuccinate synthase